MSGVYYYVGFIKFEKKIIKKILIPAYIIIKKLKTMSSHVKIYKERIRTQEDDIWGHDFIL